MRVSLRGIESKLKAYSKSEAGKAKMKECIEKYSAQGRGKTSAGSMVVTTNEMKKLAIEFKSMLQSTAQGLPESVQSHIDTISISSPQKMPDGSHTIVLSFGGNLHRDSLYEEKYPNGIDNIVALFNNGLKNKGYVYGWWNGHAPTGDESLYRSGVNATDAMIRSKKNREELQFIQRAISDFENKYKTTHNVQIIPGEHYSKDYKWETVIA